MTARLRATLARTRNSDGGWPYLAGRQSRLEPTCWAMLALGDAAAARTLSSWGGPRGLVKEQMAPTVSHTFNAIAALALASPEVGLTREGTGIAAALLDVKGIRMTDHPAIKQDSSLQGWSWNSASFSWVEPTAWCVLAVKKLCRDHPAATPRLDEAQRLLADRACTAGGWNYGNKEVYGQALLPHVPPTAAGVLALQDRKKDPLLLGAVDVLRQQAPREGSASALALAWIALAAVKHSDATQLREPLAKRVDLAESVGNLAVVAMLLYALERIEKQEEPVAFVVPS